MTGGRRPLLRLIQLARPLRGWLIFSVLAGWSGSRRPGWPPSAPVIC
jgi:hypothetical protein